MSSTTSFLKGLSGMAGALALVGLTAQTASAQAAPEPPKPNSGNLTLTGSFDFINTYMFRGILQDDTKVMMWPAVDLGIKAYSGEGGLKSVGLNFGTWNSLHTGNAGMDSKKSGLGCACGKLWYESDFYATLGLGFGGGTSLATTYTAYTSPNNGFSTVKEVMFKLSVDDSAALGKGALHPYVISAFELNTKPGSGQADGGAKAGKYVELGVAPGYSGAAASLAIPVKVALSAGNYYEAPGTGKDSKFGYFSVGGVVTAPIKGVAAGYGSWNVHAGVEFQKLGDSLKAFNAGNDHKTIVSGGLGFTY